MTLPETYQKCRPLLKNAGVAFTPGEFFSNSKHRSTTSCRAKPQGPRLPDRSTESSDLVKHWEKCPENWDFMKLMMIEPDCY
jgi:hypothetical protein